MMLPLHISYYQPYEADLGNLRYFIMDRSMPTQCVLRGWVKLNSKRQWDLEWLVGKLNSHFPQAAIAATIVSQLTGRFDNGVPEALDEKDLLVRCQRAEQLDHETHDWLKQYSYPEPGKTAPVLTVEPHHCYCFINKGQWVGNFVGRDLTIEEYVGATRSELE